MWFNGFEIKGCAKQPEIGGIGMNKTHGRVWRITICAAVGLTIFIVGCRYAVTNEEIHLVPAADGTGRTIVIVDLLGQRDTYVMD